MSYCSQACGLSVGNNFVVSGGKEDSAPNSALDTVVQYSPAGALQYLPALNHRRYNHACAKYTNDNGDNVGSHPYLIMLCYVYAIKNQLKTAKAPYLGHFLPLAVSLWRKSKCAHAQKESIICALIPYVNIISII